MNQLGRHHRFWQGARVLLTGATGGIGQAIAETLAQRGARLLLTGRRADHLQSLREAIAARPGMDAASVLIHAGDVTQADTHDALASAAMQNWGGLDVLINNAGIGAQGPWRQASPERLRQVMEVNFFAPIDLARRVLPLLKDGSRPTIAFVGSVLSHFAMGEKSEYCASKFALRGMGDALRRELAGGGIRVVMISPSTTRTPFFERSLDARPSDAPFRFGAMSPQRVAEKSVRAIEQGRRELFLTWGASALAWLDRWAPAVADRFLRS